MAKWCGKIGFSVTEEVEPGIWSDSEIVEKTYFGDVLSDFWKRQNSGDINDNINISSKISVVANSYATLHCSSIVYVEYMGEKWKVTDIEPQYPRLILSIGGVWNG